MDKPLTFRSPIAVVIWVVWLLFAVGNWIDLAVQGRDHGSAVAAAILLLATGAVYVTAARPRIIADDAGVTVRNPLRDHRVGWAGVAKVDLADLLRVHCDRGAPEGSGREGSPPRSAGRGGLGGKVPLQDRGDSQGGSGGMGPPGRKGSSPRDDRIISAWAVHYSRRRKLAAEVRARRVARFSGSRRSASDLPSSDRSQSYGAPVARASAPEADAEMIVRLLSERATAARAEAVWAAGTAETAEAKTAGTTAAGAGAAAGTAVAAAGWTQPLTSTWSGWAIAALVIPALILLAVWLL